jgi:transcription antitermination factor NusG
MGEDEFGSIFLRIRRTHASTLRGRVDSFGGRKPLPVPDHHITSLRAGLLTHRIEPHSNLEVGDRVRITTGPMMSMEGILERHKNELRVVLKLEMIGRSVSVEVGADEVEFVGPTLARTRPIAPNSFLSPTARTSAS